MFHAAAQPIGEQLLGMTRTNCSEFCISTSRRLATPSIFVPFASTPAASIGWPSSLSRHAPMPSKFSSERPMGSNRLWQLAHCGFTRCIFMRSRMVGSLALPVLSCTGGLIGGTTAGGSGGLTPRKVSRNRLPRVTGEVLVACDVTLIKAPLPSSPRRMSRSAPSVTRRNRLP